jgi:hypothetical protein
VRIVLTQTHSEFHISVVHLWEIITKPHKLVEFLKNKQLVDFSHDDFEIMLFIHKLLVEFFFFRKMENVSVSIKIIMTHYVRNIKEKYTLNSKLFSVIY